MEKITDREILLHLKHIQSAVASGASTGFNSEEGSWAEDLFFTNQKTSDILRERTGHYSGKDLED